MINNLKTSLRHILKCRLYAVTHITSLSVGVISFLLIALFVYSEFSFDRHHTKADQIFRIIRRVDSEQEINYFANVPGLLAPSLTAAFPDLIQETTRVWNYWGLGFNVRYEDRLFKEFKLAFVDSAFFEIFDVEFISGDIAHPLSAPHSIVLTESMRRKYFGDADPIGKALRINDSYELYVTAVIEDMPEQSHLCLDFLASFATLEQMLWQREINNWREGFCYTYMLVQPGSSPTDIDAALAVVQEKHQPKSIHSESFSAQALTDIHLNAIAEDEFAPGGSTTHLFILMSIAIFILMLAVLNVANLSVTYIHSKASETSIRKILGSSRSQIIAQFFSESSLLCLFAMILSFGIVDLVLPIFTQIFGQRISLSQFGFSDILFGASVLWITLACFFGLLPALFMSYRIFFTGMPQKPRQSGARVMHRKALVVFQIVIAAVLIIGAALIHFQITFIRSFDTQFKHDQIAIFPVNQTPISDQHYDSFIKKITASPDIAGATGLRMVAGYEHIKEPFRFSDSRGESAEHLLPFLLTRFDFLETFGIKIVAGRDFSRKFSTDESNAVLINQTLAGMLADDINDVIGRTMTHPGWGKLNIIGVVQDFNFESLHTPVKPLVVKMIWPHRHSALTDYLAVRLSGKEIQKALKHIQDTWTSMAPQFPFDYYFLDEKIDNFYNSDVRLGRLTFIFTIIAIGIACFGLLAFVSFIAERRTKEIAIRKILGASSIRLFRMLALEFFVLVVVANAIAWPIAYFLINRWLQNFSYRMDIPLWIFPATIFITLILALMTIFYHILKSAIAEPVQFLRYE